MIILKKVYMSKKDKKVSFGVNSTELIPVLEEKDREYIRSTTEIIHYAVRQVRLLKSFVKKKEQNLSFIEQLDVMRILRPIIDEISNSEIVTIVTNVKVDLENIDYIPEAQIMVYFASMLIEKFENTEGKNVHRLRDNQYITKCVNSLHLLVDKIPNTEAVEQCIYISLENLKIKHTTGNL